MPLVLSQNDTTESGITYDDHTGISYEYPIMYRRVIQPGTNFVYYRGRKRAKGRQTPTYFGAGVIGAVDPNPGSNGRLRCEIINYQPFEHPVPFKIGKANYLEKGAIRTGYFQQGVRRISDEEFSTILDAAKFQLSAAIVSNMKVEAVKRVSHSQLLSEDELREGTIQRMANTAWATVRAANGQKVLRKIKDKKLLVSQDDLTKHIAMLLDKQKGRCALTGIRLEPDGSPETELYCSLDRIDSAGHYTLDNLQIVCRFINRWKGSADDQEFRKLIDLVKSSKNDRG